DHITEAHFFIGTDHVGSHTTFKLAGADFDKSNAITMGGVHIGLYLGDNSGKFTFLWSHSTFQCRPWARRWSQINKRIEHFLYPKIVYGRPKKQGRLLAIEKSLVVKCAHGFFNEVNFLVCFFKGLTKTL